MVAALEHFQPLLPAQQNLEEGISPRLTSSFLFPQNLWEQHQFQAASNVAVVSYEEYSVMVSYGCKFVDTAGSLHALYAIREVAITGGQRGNNLEAK